MVILDSIATPMSRVCRTMRRSPFDSSPPLRAARLRVSGAGSDFVEDPVFMGVNADLRSQALAGGEGGFLGCFGYASTRTFRCRDSR